MRKLRTAML
jgi:hypothetical protein